MFIYKPGVQPVRGLRTSLKGAQLLDGYFQAINNLRWDTGALVVRGGLAEISDASAGNETAPSTTCLGAWAGPLNGTQYVISAWSENSKTSVYSLNLSTGVFTQLTVAGSTTRPGWMGTGTTTVGTSAGETLLASTNPVTFCVHTIPKKIEGTIDTPPRDFLTISNGTDWPLVYNPAGWAEIDSQLGKLAFHKDVRIPPGRQFSYMGTMVAKFQVATAAAQKTFTNTNARWSFADSSVAPYNSGSNYCIDLDVSNPVAADEAKVAFAAGISFPGEQINFVMQPSGAAVGSAISDLLVHTKIEVSTDNSTWYTIYDPNSTEPALTLSPIITIMDAANNRYALTFSLNNVPTSARSLRYIRFTRATSTTIAYTITILAIYGAGAGAGFPGGTEWALAYSHRFSGAESGHIVGKNQGSGTDQGYDLLKNVGGPSVVTAVTNTIAGTRLVGNPDVFFDYRFDIQNVENGTIYGGLEGPNSQDYSWSSHADLYFRSPDEAALGSDFLYWQSFSFYTPVTSGGDHLWQIFSAYTSNATQGGTPKQIISLYSHNLGSQGGSAPPDRTLRDPGTPAPSAFNVAMPRAYVVATANQRTFAGAIRDTDDNYVYSDLYISALGFPFRFASVQESEVSATRLVFAGERVRGVVMSAAAANGASTVYVLTDQSFNALGTAGGFVGSGYDASSLSTRVRINAHGTNEPGSIAERSGAIFYIDQEGQIIRFEGMSRSISRYAVDDKPKNIPASKRGAAQAVFWKDRYYLAYTPSGGSGNTHILGWNDVLGEWEFDDTLPTSVIAQAIVRAFDSSVLGSGQRFVIFGSSNQKVYGFEEGATEPGSATGPSVSLKTREYQSPELDLLRINKVQVMIDAHTATLNVDRYYKPRDTQFRTTIDCSDSESKPKAIKQDTRLPVEQTATGKSEDGWSAYIDFNGNLGSGKTIWRIDADIDGLSKGAGER